MVDPSVVPLASLLAAAGYAALYTGSFDAVLLASLSIFRQRHLLAGALGPLSLSQLSRAGAVFFITALVSSWVLRTVQTKTDTSRWAGPGKVLLFPARTTHSRVFPKKHSFSYSYLVVGIPVGWEGTAGGMVSVGVKRDITGLASWFPLNAQPQTGWYTVDATDYLERGQAELGLRGKLDAYLRSQVSAVSIFQPRKLVHIQSTDSHREPTRPPILMPTW